MKSTIAAALAAVVVLAPATASASTDSPTFYWQVRGCEVGHRGFVAKHRITEIMHSARLLTRARWRRAWHYVVCTRSRSQHLRLRAHLRYERGWRSAHRYALVYARFPAWVHAKLGSIAACESHGDPTAIGGGGAFRGLLQFTYSTWAAVGGSGDPAQASEDEQLYRGALLLTQQGAGPWPVCGA